VFLSAALEKRGLMDVSDLLNPADWLVSIFGGDQPTYSGERVTADSALMNSNVYACASILGGDIGKLPIQIFKQSRGQLSKDTEHPVAQLLGLRPNPYMSAYTLKELMMLHLVAWGNAYAAIDWGFDGRPTALWPLDPAVTDVLLDWQTGDIWYITTVPNGEVRRLPWHDVFHLKYPGKSGLKGISPISVLREEIGAQQAAKKFIGAFYSNGTATRGLIKVPGMLNKDAKNKVREEWQNLNTGLTNAHKIAILDAGMEYQSLSMPLDDAQFIETMKFGVLEIAKVYKIPAHKLNQLDRATFSNIEQQSLDYVKNTLQPIITQWEQEINYKLFTPSEQKRYYAKFNLTSELRGDAASRAAYYKSMWEVGAYSINDIRALEEQDGIGPEGDKHFVPLNYVPVNLIEEVLGSHGGKAAAAKGGDGNASDPGASHAG
jgi:HK97 family phage portal protein